MDFEQKHRHVITFAAAAVLFLGSLSYVVTVAFKNGEMLKSKQTAAVSQELDLEDEF